MGCFFSKTLASTKMCNSVVDYYNRAGRAVYACAISQCLHVKTILASRCVSFYETIEASSKLCIRFLSNLCKNYLNTVLGRNLFSIANDCSVNPSDLSKMLVKKQMKYFDVPLEHAWKVPLLQELLNTRMNNVYVGFDDKYVM